MKKVVLTTKAKAILAAAVLGLFKMFSSELPAFLQGVVDGLKNIDDADLRGNVFYKYGKGFGGKFRNDPTRKTATMAPIDPGVRRVVPYWTVRQAGLVHAILKRHIEREYAEGRGMPKGSKEVVESLATDLERAIEASQT